MDSGCRICHALFSLIYYFAPDLEEQHWYWITPGSVFGVLLWIAASFGFRVYLHFFNISNDVGRVKGLGLLAFVVWGTRFG